MPVARSFRALELYDVLANLVPGAVLLLIVSVIFPIENYIRFSTSAFAAGVFLVTALVFGHVIQAFASTIDGTPTLFGKVIRASRGEKIEDLEIEISHVEESIWPLMQRKFALPDGFEDYGEMFRLLLSYIETTPATRALRFQALHSFHRSMWAVWFMVIGLALVAIPLKCTGIVDVRTWPILALTIASAFVGILVFDRRKEKFNQRFIQYAIVDFYTDQIENTENRIQRGS
jgi:hypothetical protein